MAHDIESRLKTLGITLPTPGAPAATYVPTVTTGNLLFVSGQVPMTPAGIQFVGKVGREFSIDEGREAAKICAINILANIKAAIGDLGRIKRFVKVVGFVNAVPDFTEAHKVINGASDLMVAVFGDNGRHARTTVGVAVLPADAAVEVEGLFEIH